jgi:hypothetical protein
MKRLRPFFKYFGSKWRLAPSYPAPKHVLVVEPFAGSAQYATLYPDRAVLLVDLDETVVAVWEYLIRVSESEFLSLPTTFDHVDDIRGAPQEAKWFVGFWLKPGVTRPANFPPEMLRRVPGHPSFWCEGVRTAIASQLHAIRHWQACHGSYADIPQTRATYFVDPPYAGKVGSFYRCHNGALNYDELGAWCCSRQGQVIVCDGAGSTWLPFRAHGRSGGTLRGKESAFSEGVYTQEDGVPC